MIGSIGELHPSAARQLDLAGRVAVFEVELAPLVEEPDWWAFRAPSIYPPQKFDLSFEMENTVAAEQLLSAVRESVGVELESVQLFDEFDLGGGRKSLGVTVVVRASDHTMTDEEAQSFRRAIIDHVESSLGIKLRGGE